LNVHPFRIDYTSISLLTENDQSPGISMSQINNPPSKMAFHLLGQVRFGDFLQLQQHLLAQYAEGVDRITVLLCEHPSVLTVGRKGSYAHMRLTQLESEKSGLETHWLPRGGGCILHTAGQLAVYPLIPAYEYDLSVGQVLGKIRDSVSQALRQLGIRPLCYQGIYSVWGRTGMLAATGMSIRRGVSCFGSYINVNPDMRRYGYVDTAWKLPTDQTRRTMSCLMAENRKSAKMSKLRSAVVQSLAGEFDCDDYHLHTGHPYLAELCVKLQQKTARGNTKRV